MKINKVRELSDEELKAELARLRRHLFDLRAQAVTEKLENPSLITEAQRDVARCLTVQSERSAAGRQGPVAVPASEQAR